MLKFKKKIRRQKVKQLTPENVFKLVANLNVLHLSCTMRLQIANCSEYLSFDTIWLFHPGILRQLIFALLNLQRFAEYVAVFPEQYRFS